MSPAIENRSDLAHLWQQVDVAYATYLDRNPTPPGGALLAQTVVTGQQRRAVLATIPLRSGMDVLDLGTGFGPIPIEITTISDVRAVGVDMDTAVLSAAGSIAAGLAGTRVPGASVAFEEGNAEEVPFGADSFDLVTARLLFQHLPNPQAVVAECRRALRPGGLVHVFDVDDGLSLEYPPEESPVAILERVYGRWQRTYGDREIGRKLASLFDAEGFEIVSTTVLAQSQFLSSEPVEALSVTVNRIRSAREAIVELGLMDQDAFDALIEAVAATPPTPRFRSEGQVVLVARKR